MELKRMQRMLLEKKGLRADILEQRRTPFLQMRQDVKRKKKKIREIMQQQDKIFEDTVAFLFPEQHNYNSKSMDYRKVSIVQHPDKNEEEITMMKAILDEQHTVMYQNVLSTLKESISRGYPFFCKKGSQVFFFILYYLYTLVLTTRLIE